MYANVLAEKHSNPCGSNWQNGSNRDTTAYVYHLLPSIAIGPLTISYHHYIDDMMAIPSIDYTRHMYGPGIWRMHNGKADENGKSGYYS